MAKKKSAATPLAGEWICKKIAYEKSGDLLARSDPDDDYERDPVSAKKTEFKLATAVLTESRFELRAPEIMAEPIATGSFKKKGKTITPAIESLQYGAEL